MTTMCSSVPSCCIIRVRNLRFSTCTGKRPPLYTKGPLPQVSEIVGLQVSTPHGGGPPTKSRFSAGYFKSSSDPGKSGSRIPRLRDGDAFEIYRELGLKEKELRTVRITQQGEEFSEDSATENGIPNKLGREASGFDFHAELNPSEKGGKQSVRKPKEDNLMRIEERLKRGNEEPVMGRRSGKQIMKRSNMIAKQVISIQSALSLGFVSQLWVDTNAWVVMVVEVRPNLLSGELERCFLQDITKVGDVLLIEDESVMENEFKLVGLETLVGYTVVTPGRRNIGKVRGYNFNINSGAVESLELDSFGISIIPSSLVSTYALFVEDVVEVLPDTVVVHEAAASRIQRITKGFWGTQKNMDDSIGEFEEYSENGGDGSQPDSRQRRSRKSSSRRFRQRMVDSSNEWELPMDYL